MALPLPMGVRGDERSLGWDPSPLELLIEWVARLPFEPALMVISRLAASHWAVRTDAAAQMELLAEFLDDHPTILDRYRRFVAGTPDAIPIDEQQLMVLLRLLVSHAQPSSIGVELTGEEQALLLRVLAACGTLIGELQEEGVAGHELGSDAWVLFTLQGRLYGVSADPGRLAARTYALYGTLPQDPEARAHRDYVDLASVLKAFTGFSVGEQLALGMGLLAAVQAMDDRVPPNERGIFGADVLSSSGFAGREDEVWKLMVAERPWYQERIREFGDTPAHLVWDRRPFLDRPFIRMRDDGVTNLIAPQVGLAWTTDGLYHRLLGASHAAGVGDRFTRFNGYLTERYVLDLVRSEIPGPAGAGRVHGELSYGSGELSSDVCIDFGTDIVLIEVVSSRVRAPARVEGDLAVLDQDFKRIVFKKVAQLDRVITDFLSGRFRIPDVDRRAVQRIWPILVTADGISQAEPFWIRFDSDAGTFLQQPKVQPLTLGDLTEFEMLLEAARTRSLLEVLALKTDPAWVRRDISTWRSGDPHAPARTLLPVLTGMEEAWVAEVLKHLDLPPD